MLSKQCVIFSHAIATQTIFFSALSRTLQNFTIASELKLKLHENSIRNLKQMEKCRICEFSYQ